MIYTDEQFNVIKKASPHYITSKKEYIRNVPSWLLEDIVEVYESATGKEILHKNFSCAICVLRIIQTIGKTYFSDLEEREKIEEENKDGGTENIEEKKTNSRNNKKKKRDNSDD